MLIVIESIDGGGCQTQAELLAKNLKKLHKSTYIKFPHYDSEVGAMIKEYMYNNKNLDAREQFILYSLQFITDSAFIEKKSKDGIVVSDRFFTTTLCYQTLEGIDEKVALRFAKDFGIIKPDLVIFLDVPVTTAMKWKSGEKKTKNFREKDVVFAKKTYHKYLDLVKRNVWAKWVALDGNRPIKEVSKDILNLVQTYYEKQSR